MSDIASDIELLVEQFRKGGWRELRVETEGLSLVLSTDPAAGGLGSMTSPSVRPELVEGLPLSSSGEKKDSASTRSARTDAGEAPDPAWHAVIAPNLGTFYRSPKPGAAPFVEIGDHVSAATEICLIEVMKLFTSVQAGVVGIIRRIDVTDGDLVEGGRTLFHIEPE